MSYSVVAVDVRDAEELVSFEFDCDSESGAVDKFCSVASIDSWEDEYVRVYVFGGEPGMVNKYRLVELFE